MLFLIVGRSGSGKDFLGSLLEKKGLKGVKSYATRPKRSEDEDTHIFVTPEEAARMTNRVAQTKINDCVYFATEEQVLNSDFYIIDPNGADELIENMPFETFKIVYLEAEPEIRRMRAIARAADHSMERSVFEKRETSEAKQFKQFEARLDNRKSAFPDNVAAVLRVYNDYYPETLEKTADTILSIFDVRRGIESLINEVIDIGAFQLGENGGVIVTFTDGSESEFPISFVADTMVDDDTLLAAMVKSKLVHEAAERRKPKS